jgi:hypothetical protein
MAATRRPLRASATTTLLSKPGPAYAGPGCSISVKAIRVPQGEAVACCTHATGVTSSLLAGTPPAGLPAAAPRCAGAPAAPPVPPMQGGGGGRWVVISSPACSLSTTMRRTGRRSCGHRQPQ